MKHLFDQQRACEPVHYAFKKESGEHIVARVLCNYSHLQHVTGNNYLQIRLMCCRLWAIISVSRCRLLTYTVLFALDSTLWVPIQSAKHILHTTLSIYGPGHLTVTSLIISQKPPFESIGVRSIWANPPVLEDQPHSFVRALSVYTRVTFERMTLRGWALPSNQTSLNWQTGAAGAAEDEDMGRRLRVRSKWGRFSCQSSPVVWFMPLPLETFMTARKKGHKTTQVPRKSLHTTTETTKGQIHAPKSVEQWPTAALWLPWKKLWNTGVAT